MPRFLLCHAPGDGELAARAGAALAAAGHAAAAPPNDGSDASSLEAALADAELCLLLVTRGGSHDPSAGRALAAAERAGVPVMLVWWDEDAPSDFLANGTRPGETVEIFYACFLPVHDRLPALVERLRAFSPSPPP